MPSLVPCALGDEHDAKASKVAKTGTRHGFIAGLQVVRMVLPLSGDAMSIDWLLVARDGGILALGACALIGAVLKFNPRLFLRHFPEDLQRAVPPKTSA